MTTTRANPDDGLLDLFHNDTQTWVRAIALLQVAGGLNVALAPSQQALLSAISTNVGRLPEMLAEDQSASNSLNALESILTSVQALIQNNTNPSLVSVNTNLAALGAIETNILAKLEAMRQIDATNSNALAGINTRTLDYTNNLTTLLTALTTLNTSIVANRDPSTAVISKATLDTSNAQVTVALPANTRLLMFRARRDGTGVAQDLRYAFVTGQVDNVASGNYRILEAYNEYRERLGAYSGSLFVACTAANAGAPVVVEVEAWT